MKNLAIVICALILIRCNQPAKENPATEKPAPKPHVEKKQPNTPVAYHAEASKAWFQKYKANPDSVMLRVVMVVNRVDKDNLAKLDTIIVPNDISGDPDYYMPFPMHVKALDSVNKIICFSYPAQAFGAYENGYLVYAGCTNMGRKKDPTPTGLYFTNWKAEETTSTFNDEWNLRWNFNIENKEGIGFHQYALPGYPASHSCLRLLEIDAKYLYSWAEQWILDPKEQLLAKGTPVVVFGSYNFDGPKPWLTLLSNPAALNISEDALQKQVSDFIPQIITEQNKRASVKGSKPASS